MESFTAGTIAGDGTFRCEECEAVGPLARTADVPACPQCGSTRVARASLFGTHFERPVASTTAVTGAMDDVHGAAATVAAAMERIEGAGAYLAFLDGSELRVIAADGEQTRIGRSLTADVRFDDPTVSRRHALLVAHEQGVRVVDDRSLNGVFVNGVRIDSRTLRHGDEVLIGRYRLFFLDTTARTGELAGDSGVTGVAAA